MCVGSALNVIAHRLIRYSESSSIFYDLCIPRSHCPHCDTTLRWFELIPVVSWIGLKGRCLSCTQPISLLYPAIEILTMTTLTVAWFVLPTSYFFSYFLFFCALIVSVRTDLEHLLISSFMTLWIIPVAFACALAGLLPITLLESITGAIVGYVALWLMAKVFYWLTGKKGIGEGDFDLLACIGAFTGILGLWFTLFFASLLGTLTGIVYIILTKQSRTTPIPFGPFLASGAILYTLVHPTIVQLFNTF